MNNEEDNDDIGFRGGPAYGCPPFDVVEKTHFDLYLDNIGSGSKMSILQILKNFYIEEYGVEQNAIQLLSKLKDLSKPLFEKLDKRKAGKYELLFLKAGAKPRLESVYEY